MALLTGSCISSILYEMLEDTSEDEFIRHQVGEPFHEVDFAVHLIIGPSNAVRIGWRLLSGSREAEVTLEEELTPIVSRHTLWNMTSHLIPNGLSVDQIVACQANEGESADRTLGLLITSGEQRSLSIALGSYSESRRLLPSMDALVVTTSEHELLISYLRQGYPNISCNLE